MFYIYTTLIVVTCMVCVLCPKKRVICESCKHVKVVMHACKVNVGCSLVPRPLPDFISHSCEIKSGSGLGTRLCGMRAVVCTKYRLLIQNTCRIAQEESSKEEEAKVVDPILLTCKNIHSTNAIGGQKLVRVALLASSSGCGGPLSPIAPLPAMVQHHCLLPVDQVVHVLVSQATPFTGRERDQLSPRQKLDVTNQIRALRRSHPLRVQEYNYVTMCLADASILLPNRYVR